MGEYTSKAWLGAHNSALSAWADLSISPDGNTQKTFIGTIGGNLGGPAVTVQNSNGNVGIGTTTPSYSLNVGGTSVTTGGFGGSSNAIIKQLISQTASGKYTQLAIQGPSDGGSGVQFYNGSGVAIADFGMDSSGGGLGFVNRKNSGFIQYFTTTSGGSTVERMRIDSTGNVGIGTTSPGAKLEVNGVIRVPQGTGGYSFPALSAASHGIYSNDGTNDIWLSPFYDILFAPANSSGRFRPSNDNTSGLGTPTQRWLSLSVGTGSSTFAGNVGIGTTGPSYKLDVAGDINTSTCFRLSSGTTVGGTCTSDERLKEDVQDYTGGLSDLLKIKLHTYKFNGLGEMPKTHEDAVGVIAQEVEKTNPELVKTRMVQMHPDDSEKTEIKVVDYSKFSYMLINAVKELYAKWLGHDEQIEQLKSENAQLKANDEQKTKKMVQMEARLERLEKALSSK